MPQTRSLSETEIQDTYELLEKMYVPVEENKMHRGLGYVRDRLTLCRAMQDQAHDLVLKTGRAYSWVQEQLIYAKSATLLAGSDQEKDQLKIKIGELEQQKVSHNMLHTLVKRHTQILSGTQRDIKLLADVMQKQIKLAEEDSGSEVAEELMQPVDLSKVGYEIEDPNRQVGEYFDTSDAMQAAAKEIFAVDLEPGDVEEPKPQTPTPEEVAPLVPEPNTKPAPEPSKEPEPTRQPELVTTGSTVPPAQLAQHLEGYPSALDELAGLFASTKAAEMINVTPASARVVRTPDLGAGVALPVARTEVVDFDDPLPVAAAEVLPRGLPVADMSSVSIDQLFEDPNASDQPSSPSYRAF